MTESTGCRGIPGGITFGTQVLVVPGIASGFTHSGSIQSLIKGQNYRWVQRGEPIAEFSIEGSLASSALIRAITSRRYTAAIRSPASGLVLHTSLDTTLGSYLEDGDRDHQAYWATFTLLLPDDEPRAEGSEYIYGGVCRLVHEFRHYYLKPSRYWTMVAFQPKGLSELISLQSSVESRIFDVLPRWADYLDEARTNHSCLRPYLKHLR